MGCMQVPPGGIKAALLRGTTADTDGNVSFEKEALYGDQISQVTREQRLLAAV